MTAVRTLSGRQEIVAIAVRDASNVLRTVTVGKVRTAAGALKTFFSALAAAAEPTQAFGAVASSADEAITTDACTATPEGGVAPFTYAWEQIGASDWTINSPTASVTTFTSPAVGPYLIDYASFRCIVTDASGAQAITNHVSAEVRNLGSPGFGEVIL